MHNDYPCHFFLQDYISKGTQYKDGWGVLKLYRVTGNHSTEALKKIVADRSLAEAKLGKDTYQYMKTEKGYVPMRDVEVFTYKQTLHFLMLKGWVDKEEQIEAAYRKVDQFLTFCAQRDNAMARKVGNYVATTVGG